MPPNSPKLVREDVHNFDISPDNTRILTVSDNRREQIVRLFHADTLREAATYAPRHLIPWSVAFARDDMAILLGRKKTRTRPKHEFDLQFVLQRLRVTMHGIHAQDHVEHREHSNSIPHIFSANGSVIGVHHDRLREDIIATRDLSTVIYSNPIDDYWTRPPRRRLIGTRMFKLVTCRGMEGGWGFHHDLYCFGEERSTAVTQARHPNRES